VGDAAKSPEAMQHAGERAGGLTGQLPDVSRKQIPNRAPVDLVESVRKMEETLKRTVNQRIEVQTDFGKDVPRILADESNIGQVLFSLVANARDAMPNGGKISIRVVEQVVRSLTFKRHDDAHDGRYALLTVTDSGCGMDAETQSRLFDPYFTTKSVKGAGLALSAVRDIVKQHEGWIEVESGLEVGSTFRVFFPAVNEKPGAGEKADVTGAPATRRECIPVNN
jgi:signal transduction histidine kinase